MKFLIMTEGQCEEGILNALLDKKILKYSIDDLLYLTIFHLRQINQKVVDMILQLPPNEMVTIIRVGDKLSDELKIPKEIADRIYVIKDICTKPELETLYIIYNKQLKQYEKIKSKFKPSEFMHQIDKNYRKSYDFHYEFFMNLKNQEIYDLFKEYDSKRKHTHLKNQESLMFLLKQ